MVNTSTTNLKFINNISHNDYRPDIDGLRAIAVVIVVLYHAFPEFLRGGFIGVDIFFVISGYLITSIIILKLNKNEFNFMEFYVNRIRRIFPALILILLFCLILGWHALLADEYKMLGKHVAGGAAFIANYIFLSEVNYFDVASEKKQLLHLWSLGVEEQFYIFWPIILWFAWKIRFNILLLIIAVMIISFILNIKFIHHDSNAAFYSPQSRFWELLAGACLAYFKINHLSITRRILSNKINLQNAIANINNIKSLSGVLLILICLFRITNQNNFPGWWAMFPVLGATLIISAGYQSWFNRAILSNRVLIWVGLISYPLYLWHWPLLSFSRVIYGEVPPVGLRFTIISISFLFAWLTYYFLEKPIRFFDLNRSVKRYTILCLVILMMLIGFTGLNIFNREGLSFRYKNLNQIQLQRDIESKSYSNEYCRLANPSFKGYYCVKSKPIEPTVLILGDSHANRLYTGLYEKLNDNTGNVLNFGHHYCAPFPSFSGDKSLAENECSNYAKYGLEFAKNNNSVKTVILLFRGALYINDLTNINLFEEAMRKSLLDLTMTNKNIIFVLDNPELDPQSCLESRPLSFNIRVKQPCAIAQKGFDAKQSKYRDLVFRVLKDFPEIKIYDTSKKLCDGIWCWAINNGKLLYSDRDHLSVEGSRYIADDLMELIKQ